MMVESFNCLVFVLILFCFTIYCSGYTQYEINTAWKKMMKKEYFYKFLDDQLGCWPQNTIPYTIEGNFSIEQINHIKRHIYQIQNRTCLRWVERKRLKDVQKHVWFFHGKNPDNCYNQEGGNELSPIITKITLGDNCFPHESVIHEMLHALGFNHEHQRIDRDCYVFMRESNPRVEEQFKIIFDDLTFEKWEKWSPVYVSLCGLC